MEARHGEWSISLGNGFHLVDASGNQVPLEKRRAEELLLILAKAPQKRISRDFAAEQMWPTENLDTRRVNFRQALCHLKRKLGEERIFADRNFCGFTKSFSVRIETEPRSSDHASLDSGIQNPVDSFLTVLHWLAENDPVECLEALRANFALASAIAPKKIVDVIDLISSQLGVTHHKRNETSYWYGFATLLREGILRATPLLKEATERSIVANDSLMIEEASAKWSVCEILAGRPHAGLSLLDRADTLIPQSQRRSRAQSSVLRASALHHLGTPTEGNILMEQIGHQSKSGFAANESLRGLYQATSGNYQAAIDITQTPLKYSEEFGDGGTHSICRLTLGYVAAIHDPDQGINSLTELIASCERSGRTHVSLYALEAIALAHWRSKRLKESQQYLDKANALRKKLGFGFTFWDQSRFRLRRSL